MKHFLEDKGKVTFLASTLLLAVFARLRLSRYHQRSRVTSLEPLCGRI